MCVCVCLGGGWGGVGGWGGGGVGGGGDALQPKGGGGVWGKSIATGLGREPVGGCYSAEMRRPAIRSTAHDPILSYPTYQPPIQDVSLQISVPNCVPLRGYTIKVCREKNNTTQANNNTAEKRLTHWGRVTHICVSNFATIGSDNGLSPGRRQAIIWTNAVILLIEPLATNFSEILIGIHTFSFQKIHLKKSSGKWRLFCLGLNVSTYISSHYTH